jgi:glucose-6-phosphate isomerase
MSEKLVRLDYGYCTAGGLAGGQGVGPDALAALGEELKPVMQNMQADFEAGKLGFMELPATSDEQLAPIYQQVERVKKFADTIVVMGIGGSALGATAVDMALHGALRQAFPRPEGCMRLFVADNSDPAFFGQLLDNLDLHKTVFNVVSKSGSTAETMSQYLLARERLESGLGRDEANKRVIFTTDPVQGNLRILAQRDPIPCLEVPPNVGGRFSVLTAVGLLPLACAGHDIKGLLAGAASMQKRCGDPDISRNPAALFAALAVHYWRASKNILVMMPYSSDLFGLAQWFGQLWAESLGKAQNLAGEKVNVGQTPVAAVGATDQHSQVQLYMEGPLDKLTCFVTVDQYAQELTIPGLYGDIASLSYLGGQSMAQLIQAEARATQAALASQGRPSLCLKMPRISAHSIGEVFYLLEAATVMAGGMWGINPLDQPGVELGKVLTYGLMGRDGFAEQKQRMDGLDYSGKYLA